MEERKKAINALAKDGSFEAIGALKNALASGTDELRVAIAESLGACASVDCTLFLQGLLNDSNAALVKAAVRSLAQQGSPEAMAALTQLLYDSQRSAEVRCPRLFRPWAPCIQPGVLDTLTQAALNLNDPGVRHRNPGCARIAGFQRDARFLPELFAVPHRCFRPARCRS